MTHHTGSDEGLSEVGLSDDELDTLDTALDPLGDPRGEFLAVRVHEAVERILAARAAAPDALRERVEALAAEWESEAAALNDGGWHATEAVLFECADDLRAALADPTDGATT